MASADWRRMDILGQFIPAAQVEAAFRMWLLEARAVTLDETLTPRQRLQRLQDCVDKTFGVKEPKRIEAEVEG